MRQPFIVCEIRLDSVHLAVAIRSVDGYGELQNGSNHFPQPLDTASLGNLLFHHWLDEGFPAGQLHIKSSELELVPNKLNSSPRKSPAGPFAPQALGTCENLPPNLLLQSHSFPGKHVSCEKTNQPTMSLSRSVSALRRLAKS